MNDDERKEWVMNDEGLYNWWLSERRGIVSFVRDHRVEIDAAVASALR